MGKRYSDPLPREVDLVKRRVQEWRQAKTGSCRVPSEIEAAAISLAKVFGVCRIAREVGLNYAWLRTKVTQTAKDIPSETLQFLELHGGISMMLPPARSREALDTYGNRDSGAVIEISKADGARMQIRIESGSSLDAAGIVAAFLGPKISDKACLFGRRVS